VIEARKAHDTTVGARALGSWPFAGRVRRRTVVCGAVLLIASGSAWVLLRPSSLPAGVLRIVPVADDAIAVDIAVDAQAGRVIMQSGDVTRSGTVSVLDAATGRLVRAISIGNFPAAHLVVDARVNHAFVTTATTNFARSGSRATGNMTIVDTRTGQVIQSSSTGAFPGVGVDPLTGHVFVTSSAGGGTQMLDARDGRLLGTVAAAGDRIAIDGRTGRTFVVDGQANHISMVDTRTGRVLHVMTAGRAVGVAVVDERTNRLFVGSPAQWACGVPGPCRFASPSRLVVLDTRSGRLVKTLTAGTDNPAAVAVDARTGRAFVFYTDMTSTEGTLRVLDARTARVLRRLPVDVAPDERGVAIDQRRGRIYAVNNRDGVQVFDATTGLLIRTIAAPGDAIAVDERSGHAFIAQRWSPHPSFIDPSRIWSDIQVRLGGRGNPTINTAPVHYPGSVAIIDAAR